MVNPWEGGVGHRLGMGSEGGTKVALGSGLGVGIVVWGPGVRLLRRAEA